MHGPLPSPTAARSCLLIALLLVVVALAGCAHETDGGDGDTPGSAGEVRFDEHEELGNILVDGDGMTLYIFTNDEPGVSNCKDGCAENWPPLVAEELPDAPAGHEDRFSLIDRDGTQQVAIDDQPLYYFAQDEQAGDANGEGLNESWFVVRESGESG